MYPGAHAPTAPDRPAVIMAATGESVTYRELEDRSIQTAHLLRSLGLGVGSHIALVSTNEARVFDIYWAAVRSGMYITAVNHHLTAPDIAYIVDDCDAEVVIFSASLAHIATDERFLAGTPRVRSRLVFGGGATGYDDLDAMTATQSTDPPADQPRGADMLYSSGTTGRPKGIEPSLPDRQVHEPGDSLTALSRDAWGVGPDSVYLSPAPLYHAAPLRTCAAVHALGGTVIVMDRFDAEGALAAIEHHRVSHSQWVPTMFVRMLKLPSDVREKYDTSSLQAAIHAAAPCPREVKQAMIDWWGPVLHEYYSSTEVAGMTIIDSAQWLAKPGSVGRDGLIGIVHICDEVGTELPAGGVGTVYFERDEQPFRYHKDQSKTAAAQHPEHELWNTTGDVGYLDEDRYLFLTDRRAFTIISGGVNIYPQEIENALTMHPSVFDIAVIGEPDEDLGESVLAVVQLVPGTDPATAEGQLRAHADQHLARFTRPRRYSFVDELPRTPTGKLAKHRIVLTPDDRTPAHSTPNNTPGQDF